MVTPWSRPHASWRHCSSRASKEFPFALAEGARWRTQSGMNDSRTNLALLDIAGDIDSMVHAELCDADDPFRLHSARIYVLNNSGDVELLGEAESPYDAMIAFARPADAVAGVVVVTGWVAPVDENAQTQCRPSQHPQAERIRLTVAVGDDGIGTVMRRKSLPDVAMAMDERGVGDLPEALEAWWSLT